MFDCKPVSTPFAAHFKLQADSSPKSEEDIERMYTIPYTSAVGSLMYVMVCTRPDLAFALSMVSRYMYNSGKDHWNAVKWILCYVKGSFDIGLVFDKAKASSYDVIGFVDSDYGGDLDRTRSISGYNSSLCSGAISWKAQLQSIAALSSTEAEYIVATEAKVLLILPRQILIARRPSILALNTTLSEILFVAGEIVVKKFHTSENSADMFTKPLAITKFKHCLDLVGVLYA
ncbi:secreted RxLR effector protein 161-like [Lycium ferocissimum]|uniref:secreted RxLR effector protein 161-like n=1 Tax=Lycium ferocissimum TaxID=112874 RepID=UPI0028156056|nr:secreted RxLR effector protein 161-like [Lycium ferocissimum]